MSQPSGPELTSIRSPRVKAARQLSKRALRLRTRSFLAEGPQAVSEALARGGVVTELFLTAAARSRHGGLAAQASRQGAAVHAVSGEVMAELAQTITPQGIVAVCRFVDVPLSALTAAAPGGDPRQRPGPGQRGNGAAHRGRGGRGRRRFL